jgi:hypothetical protein
MLETFERRPADHSPHRLSVASGPAIQFRQVIVRPRVLLIFPHPRESLSRVDDRRMPDMTNRIIARLVLAIECVDRDHEADVLASPAAKTFVHSPDFGECLSWHDLYQRAPPVAGGGGLGLLHVAMRRRIREPDRVRRVRSNKSLARRFVQTVEPAIGNVPEGDTSAF